MQIVDQRRAFLWKDWKMWILWLTLRLLTNRNIVMMQTLSKLHLSVQTIVLIMAMHIVKTVTIVYLTPTAKSIVGIVRYIPKQ